MGKPRRSLREVRLHRLRDISIAIASLYLAFVFVHTGAINDWIATASGYSVFASFLSGMFFTSLLTTAPAIVALGELSLANPILSVAVPGALGALIGDLILFTFVRDSVSQDVDGAGGKWGKAMRRAFKHPYLRWLAPVVGALIIASPLPDELGIAMLGLSRAPLTVVVPLSLVMNFAGIVLIGLAARAL